MLACMEGPGNIAGLLPFTCNHFIQPCSSIIPSIQMIELRSNKTDKSKSQIQSRTSRKLRNRHAYKLTVHYRHGNKISSLQHKKNIKKKDLTEMTHDREPVQVMTLQ